MIVRQSSRSFFLPPRLMLLFLLAAPLGAQPASPPSTAPATHPATAPSLDRETIQKWFQALANPDAALRDEARQRLMSLAASDLPTLQQVVKEARPLWPAQVAALHDVVLHVYLAGDLYASNPEQGFLGIGMGAPAFAPNQREAGEEADSLGVVVLSRFPGFPGYRWLLDGDVILGVKTGHQSQRVDASQDLSNAIAGQPGGSALILQVQRQGRVLEVPVILAPMPQAAMPVPGAANRFEAFQAERLHRGETYWDRHFAPLMRQNML